MLTISAMNRMIEENINNEDERERELVVTTSEQTLLHIKWSQLPELSLCFIQILVICLTGTK